MESTEFKELRAKLGKTQAQMAQLLGVSLKAVHSYEQGWRNIPVHVERQLLFLLAQKNNTGRQVCWDIRQCSEEVRQSCPAWEFNAGHLCWFINGTICNNDVKKNWDEKIAVCRKCPVFKAQMNL